MTRSATYKRYDSIERCRLQYYDPLTHSFSIVFLLLYTYQLNHTGAAVFAAFAA